MIDEDTQAALLSALGALNRRLGEACDLLSGLQEAARPLQVVSTRAKTTTSTAVAVGNDGYAAADTILAPYTCRRVDVFVYGPANLVFQMDTGEGHWSDPVELPNGAQAYSVPAAVRSLRVKTADATAVAQSRYAVVFWN